MGILYRFKPGVPRRVLLIVGAVAWGFAGAALAWRGATILAAEGGAAWGVIAAGVAAGAFFFRFLFRRIADRSVSRIRDLGQERPCVFSFLDWRGYGMMAGMITLGIILRATGAVPPLVLGPLYIAMSVALLSSSVRLAAVGVRG